MEVRVSVYLISIIIIRLYIALDELMGRKTIFNQPTISSVESKSDFYNAKWYLAVTKVT